MLAKNAVLLTKVIYHLQLTLIHPPGDGDHDETEWIQDSRHLVSPLSRAANTCEERPRIANRVFGPYDAIIAMTADVIEGCRERCIEAGMDDYTSKPVNMNAIVAALEKCVPNMDLRPRDASSPCPVT